MALKINLYRNNNTASRGYGKIYARVDGKETLDLSKLAEHMHAHNTPYSMGIIKGVLTDMVACIRELCLDGNKVKIDDLAIFSCQVKSTGANSYLKFDISTNIEAIRLGAYATGEFRRSELLKDGTIAYSKLAQSKRDAERPQPEPEP